MTDDHATVRVASEKNLPLLDIIMATGKKGTLWDVFGRWVKFRDSNISPQFEHETDRGIIICISCGKPIIHYWIDEEGKLKFNKGCHAGHFYSRGSTWAALYFDEFNVNGQGAHCNTFLGGNIQGYREGLKVKYGEAILKYLHVKKNNQCSWNDVIYDTLIEEYKQKIKIEKERLGISHL